MNYAPGDRIIVTNPNLWVYLTGTYITYSSTDEYHRIRFDGLPKSIPNDMWLLDEEIRPL